MTAYEETLKDLVSKLKELFQMDQADLDFGIYRVMKAKHDEIDKFLTKDLLPTVKKTLEATGKSHNKRKELDEIVSNLRNASIDPDTSPKVQELKALLDNDGSNSENDAKDIFSSLITFFSRYYSGGDFMSLRRYKKDTYSPLPMSESIIDKESTERLINCSPLSMNGEEVKLHWANADQYYIKSSENLTNYAFVDDPDSINPLNVKFVLVAATTEQNNNKLQEGERVFTLASESPFEYSNDKHELSIKFEYQVDAKKRKQKDINTNIVKHIEKLTDLSELPQWPEIQSCLLSLRATKANPKRTLIEKHLTDFTAKNKFDYFIHKDLGGFLNKELDYFIKSELVKLDDIIPSAPTELNDLGLLLEKQILTNESQLKKVIALKSIAQKIIQFLAQLENFQKKLWLKKKFVLDSNYCITLDLIPLKQEVFAEILNPKQLDEWSNLFSVDPNTIKKKFNTLTLDEFVNTPEYKSLVVDTKFLSVSTKFEIIGSFDELDSACGGLLINSENSQALRLVGSSLKNKVANIFIDPPYNTGDDGFLYKDNFASSSWLSMISERLDLGMGLLVDDGAFYASIGDEEQEHLSTLIRHKFGKRRFFANLIWEKKKKGSFLSGNIAKMKDYILAVSKNEQEFKGLVGEIATGTETYPCVNASNPRELRTIPPGIASKFKQQNYTLNKGSTISAGNMDLVLHSDLVIKGGYLAETLVIEGNWRYSQTKMAIYAELNELYITQDLYLRRIVNEPRPKRMKDLLPRLGSGGDDFRAFDLNDLSKFGWGTNEDANDELHQIMGSQYSASYPKPSKLITLLLAASRHEEGVFLDYFAGSGTTGHAVLNLNRADSNNRKYALIEMGQYFNTVLKPRMEKLVYSSNWVNGKPTDVNTGLSHIFKYVELESYEDVLSNIYLKPTNQQEELFGLSSTKQGFSEDYTLKYMLDFESKSQIVNPKLFESPFDAKIKIVRNNQVENRNVDLIETFNYLLGLSIMAIRKLKGIVEVVGTTNDGDKCLILWRDVFETTNDKLDEWFKKQDYNSRDMEFDLIYVNGDNNLPNLKTGTDHWKVQLIETEFYKLMFDVNEL